MPVRNKRTDTNIFPEIKLTSQGNDITRFVDNLSVSWAMDSTARKFTASLTINEGGDATNLPSNARISLYLTGKTYFKGYLSKLSSKQTGNSISITIEALSDTTLALNSTIGENIVIAGKMSLLQVCKKVLKKLEVFNVDIIDVSDVGAELLEKDQFNSTPDTTVFEYLDRICRRYGVSMYADAENNIYLIRGNKANQSRMYIDLTEDGNTATDVDVSINNEERFYQYTVHGKRGSAKSKTPVTTQSVYAKAVAYDEGMPKYLKCDICIEKDSVKYSELLERAKWEASVRRARSITHSVSLFGYRDPRTLDFYDVHKQVKFSDKVGYVDGELIIKDLSLNYDAEAGTTVDLTLTGLEAFLPEPLPTKNKKAKKGRKRGKGGKRGRKVDVRTAPFLGESQFLDELN